MRFQELFKSIKEGQKAFGEDIAVIINSVLLTLVYIFGVGFTFLIAKFSNKNFLDLKIKKDSETYWEDLNLTKKPVEAYYRQF